MQAAISLYVVIFDTVVYDRTAVMVIRPPQCYLTPISVVCTLTVLVVVT